MYLPCFGYKQNDGLIPYLQPPLNHLNLSLQEEKNYGIGTRAIILYQYRVAEKAA